VTERAGGRRAVIYDVARLAGVSHQTVSRVINGSRHVRPETRERVRAAMEKLDYRPNTAARALVTGSSKTLGVVTFDTTQYGPASTLVGIERAANAAGYVVSIVSLEALTRPAVERAVGRLRTIGVDGVLIVAPEVTWTAVLRPLLTELPVVALEAGPLSGVAVADVDQYRGARLATEHLLSLGHRTVHHLAGPPEWLATQQRIEGWRDALNAAGAPVSLPVRGDWSPRAGYEMGRDVLRLPDVTAIFVANDQMALGLLRLLHELGRDVPGEVSVVGFDDTPESEFFSPPLTTVRQDFNEMGRRGLQLLIRAIAAGNQPDARETVPASLVLRASTGPPAAVC
jgi:DNA-binding LacI/PurR family transcriptional regulator